jgi:hypothetical protein
MGKGKLKLNESKGTIDSEPELEVSATDAPQDGMMARGKAERRSYRLVHSKGRVKVNELADLFKHSQQSPSASI